MGDHSNETLQLQKRRDAEASCNQVLAGRCLDLDKYTIPSISNHIDCFVSQSRGNESIYTLDLHQHAFKGQYDDVWDKVGQAVGNLQALEKLLVSTSDYDGKVIPNFEILARILNYVRQRITLKIGNALSWDAKQSKLLARAIHRHPSIYSFEGGGGSYTSSYESMNIVYSALATLPALESIKLENPWTEDIATWANTESLTELLRVPTLRSVGFSFFSFAPALFQATANALMEGTAITNLKFGNCSFAAEASTAMMIKSLSRNTSVTCIDIVSPRDGTLCNALAAALPSNSTLRRLDLNWERNDPDSLSLFLSALGQNTGLKTLIVRWLCSMDESVCTAMRNGLGMNETLESLELTHAPLCDDNADLWCRAFSFLRTNKALKSLLVNLKDGVTESCLSAFRLGIAAILQDNASLESITIQSVTKIEAKDYLAFITALQGNSTLKTLSLTYGRFRSTVKLQLTDDEDKRILSLLKNSYSLECLPSIHLEAGDVGAILRLNEAGRRYLIDGSSISKGVEVLGRVNNDINCVFLHLLENPRLCDRSAVEKVSAVESNSSLTNPTACTDSAPPASQPSFQFGSNSAAAPAPTGQFGQTNAAPDPFGAAPNAGGGGGGFAFGSTPAPAQGGQAPGGFGSTPAASFGAPAAPASSGYPSDGSAPNAPAQSFGGGGFGSTLGQPAAPVGYFGQTPGGGFGAPAPQQQQKQQQQEQQQQQQGFGAPQAAPAPDGGGFKMGTASSKPRAGGRRIVRARRPGGR